MVTIIAKNHQILQGSAAAAAALDPKRQGRKS
jgi:hypothetical protein